VNFKLVKHRENASVRTAGAENRRTVGSLLLLKYSLIGAKENSAKKICAVFALSCKELLALDLKSPCSDLLLDNGLKLLEYVNGLYLAYEFLNEPTAPTCTQWNELVSEFIKNIRKEEPNRCLVIGSNRWNAPGTIDSLSIPQAEKNVILSFHFYGPILVTHHQAPWHPLTKFFTDKVNYPGWIIEDTSCYDKYTEEQRQFLRRENFNAVPDSLTPHFNHLKEFADSLGVQLNCGEFGVYPYHIDKEARLRWYRDMARLFCEHKISNTHWCYKGDFPVVKKDGSANELPAILLNR
jgi:endoglucanase